MKQDIKNRVINRLRILQGQIRGIQNMVEKEEYCVRIIHQTLAAKHALSSIEDLILENHLSTHVVRQIKHGKESKAIKEILDVYKLSKRK